MRQRKAVLALFYAGYVARIRPIVDGVYGTASTGRKVGRPSCSRG